MAVCKSCRYWIPDDAKKCAHCGDDTWIPDKFKTTGFQWFWKGLTTLISISTLLVAGFIGWQSFSLNRQTNIIKKNFELEYIPVVKIGAVAFNFVEYPTQSGSGLAMYFTIPIENKHGYAYRVKILKKDITLLRGKFGLETPCIQSPLTKRSFELSPGQIKYDQIGIDEEPVNFEKFRKGGAVFTIEYKIQYEAMPEARRDIYTYNYIIEFRGVEQRVVVEETTRKSQ